MFSCLFLFSADSVWFSEGGDGGFNSSEEVEVDRVVSPSGIDAHARGGSASTSASTHGSVAGPAKVVNPYLKESRGSGSRSPRPEKSPGNRAPGGGAPTPSALLRRDGYVRGVGVPTPHTTPRRKSGPLAVQPSPAPAAVRPTEVVARVDNVHVNKSIHAAVAHSVPKELNAALTGAALKKAVDSRDFNQSLGAVVKRELSGPAKKFKDDVRKSAADATAEGVANVLKGPLQKMQQVMEQGPST